MRKRQPPAGLALHGTAGDDLHPAYSLATLEPRMPLSDDELAEILGLTPDQAARVPADIWAAVRELLAS